MTDDSTGSVFTGLAIGIIFVVIFAIFPIPDYPMYALSFRIAGPDYYLPLLQMRISGVQEQYKVGEKVEFEVAQKGTGKVFPEIITITNVDGKVVWMLDNRDGYENSLMFGPIIFNPLEHVITWRTSYVEQIIVINEPSDYMVIAKLEHVTVEKNFRVIL